MIRSLSAGFLIVAGTLAFLVAAPLTSASPLTKAVVGHSVKGRAIVAWRQGNASSNFRVLVVGSIHGDERQGMRVVARLRRRLARQGVPRGAQVWTIRTANPDGTRAGTRRNGRRVDLNRNFPYRWDGGLSGGYFSGRAPASEPETKAIMRLSRSVRFDLAIWYHQPWGRTLIPCNRDRRWARLYSRLSGLAGDRGCDRGYYPGSAISWQHHRMRTAAFVVELGSGRRSRSAIRSHARAVVLLIKRAG
ncbi:MAG: succinylglutamate desuccinylase/aspartoacylase family protein [Solirubrobacterales bacterium]|nr:succinylglutamate desuccinylase/aspartoacylase family protein [Solirubrobacterales bacterium]